MLRSSTTIVMLVLAIGLSACASMDSDTISAFDKGMTSAKSIIADRSQAMDNVKAYKAFEAQFYVSEQPLQLTDPRLQKFVDVVCAKSDFLHDQQQQLDTLGTYDSMLDDINKKPSADVAGEFSSIVNNWNSAAPLKPSALRTLTSKDCSTEVANLMTMPTGSVPEGAAISPTALLTAAGSLYTALNTAAVFALGLTDDYVRGQKIAAYVQSSKKTVDAAFAELNAVDDTTDRWCQSIHRAPPCTSNPPTKLDSVMIAEKWLALKKPWHIYLAMYATEAVFKDNLAKNPSTDTSPYFYLLDKQQDEFRTAIGDYRTLASTQNVGDIARAMKSANDTLYDLTSSPPKLTKDQAWAVLSNFYAEIKEAVSDYSSLQTASKSFVSAANGEASSSAGTTSGK